MAIIFFEGFELPIAGEGPDANWTSAPSAYTTGRITGRAVSSQGLNTRALLGNYSTLIAGVATRMNSSTWPSNGDSANNFLSFRDASTVQIEIRYLRGAIFGYRFAVYRGATQIAISSDLPITATTWYYLEAKVVFHASAGSVEVRLNGVPISGLTLTGISTISSANAYANVLGLSSGAQGGTWNNYFDDLYCLDTTGSAPLNDFLGDVRVETLVPTADALKQWTPSTGSTNYPNVAGQPMVSTTYNSASAAGLVDRYGLANLTSTPSSIFAVGVVYNFDKNDAGARTTRAFISSGGTVANGTIRGPDLNNRRTWQDYFIVDPNTGGNWTAAAVNALQAGMEVVT